MIRFFIIAAVLVNLVENFPDGAPADSCVKARFNQPNHGQTRTQPLETSPYQVVASTDQYQGGDRIQVSIAGHDIFRGFFLQARDAQTNEWIGSWQESANTKTIPECASITHADNKDKAQASLVWIAPKDRQGQVFFT